MLFLSVKNKVVINSYSYKEFMFWLSRPVFQNHSRPIPKISKGNPWWLLEQNYRLDTLHIYTRNPSHL